MNIIEKLRIWQRIAEKNSRGLAPVDYVVMRQAADEIEKLRKLCYASLHLLKGSDLIYDPRNDTGPTNWRETRDRLIAKLERVV